jgi:pimeloyl-ACP methyl ester carboxylesterase
VTDWPHDHAELLDALGIERAGVLAQSGGTPFALAVGAALPSHTSGIAFMGAVAPLEDPAAFAETGRQLRTALTLARRAPWLLRLGLRAAARGARRDPEKAARKFVKGVPAADARALEDPELWALHVRATAEILAHPDGFVDEVRLLSAPWCVDPAAISVPAAFWSGDGDTIHPTSHSRRLAALMHDAQVTVVPDTATFGLLPFYPDALRFACGQ